MGRRARRIASVFVALAAIAAAPGTSGPPRVGSTFYLVEADARLCPSPACGGYWVRLANGARTRCSDGVARSRCYVARSVDEQRRPLAQAVPHGALARAAIEPWKFEGLGELGMLVVAQVFVPAGRAPPSGRYFRVVDLGIRCVRAPCFSLRASQLNDDARITLSGVDLDPAHLEAAERRRALAELAGTSGLLARGRIVRSSDGGRELRATRAFLRDPPPRA